MLMTLTFDECYRQYEHLLSKGVAKEVARGVLPMYIYSSMYVTLNARSLMAFLSLRTKYENSLFPSFPMWEIEQCVHLVDAYFEQLMPITREAFRQHGSVCP